MHTRPVIAVLLAWCTLCTLLHTSLHHDGPPCSNTVHTSTSAYLLPHHTGSTVENKFTMHAFSIMHAGHTMTNPKDQPSTTRYGVEICYILQVLAHLISRAQCKLKHLCCLQEKSDGRPAMWQPTSYPICTNCRGRAAAKALQFC